MKKWLALFSLIAAIGAVTGCQPTEPEGVEGGAKPAGTSESSTTTSQGTGSTQLVEYRNKDGKLVCPIMNSVIDDESKIKGWVEYEGKKYAMCCDSCAKVGPKDPALVAKKASEIDAKG